MQVNDMLSFDIRTVHNFLQFRGGQLPVIQRAVFFYARQPWLLYLKLRPRRFAADRTAHNTDV